MSPKTIYKTVEEKKQALRENASRYYYKKKQTNLEANKELKKQKKIVRDYLKTNEGYKKVYQLLILQTPEVLEQSTPVI